MTLTQTLAVNAAVTGLLMLVVWAVSVRLRDVSIVDVLWGPGFVVIALATFLTIGGSDRGFLLVTLTAIWGLRLAIHLGRRKYGSPEDYRYQAMRERIGPSFWLASLFVVFLLQGVIMNIVALPIVVGQRGSSPLNSLDVLGCGVWFAGLMMESIGDWQLTRFRADPANHGKVLDRGLWAYTRHPNYFGDFLVWWGLFLVGLAGSGEWWTIVSPLLMSVLLMRVSGVTLLEHSLKERKPGYADYVARTSAFFPWPPRPRHSNS